ncbi:YidH family protein [Hymenobacter sp. DG25B]|jgi:putative membrane protein|uniref:YidH family protein n=1 Tax=Hymenobacter sp. DG25B TaxID=1385664 RepID=UPI0005CB23F0|nr:DUF202 domain-containing protein [Hymenobacter sp. DG25B]
MAPFRTVSRRDFRELMALERTHMANERTMLAYVRTAMTLIVAGFSLIQFFRDNFFVWVGVALVPIGVGVIVAGWLRYRQKTAHMSQDATETFPNTTAAV